jgi:hypothetical protein
MATIRRPCQVGGTNGTGGAFSRTRNTVSSRGALVVIVR